MRLCPSGHPLARHMSRWPRLYVARTAWSHRCREGVAHAANLFRAAGVPAWGRVWPNFKKGGVWDVFFKAGDDRLGWLNFAPTALFPTHGTLDAPVVATVALNCLAPRCGGRLYAWMEEVGLRPAVEAPCELLWGGRVAGTHCGEGRLDADVFASPELRVAVNCHWTEIVRTGLRLADLQARCLQGEAWAPRYDGGGQVVVEERWTPLAREVYDAWTDILAAADLAEILADETTAGKRRHATKVPGHKNRVALGKKPAHVKRAFLRILSPPPPLRPPDVPPTS